MPGTRKGVVRVSNGVGELEDSRLHRLEREIFGNGRPGLESRMREHIQERQDAMAAQQDVRHTQNTRKIDRLSWIVAIGVGIVVTLNAVVLGRIH